jgi:GH43 family beta-xylosidase
VGLLTADENADLLNPDNWVKENYPLLSSRSVEGEFGTGHNAYVIDEDGLVWNTYHARPGVEGPRSSGIRRVHFNRAGFPVLDMTEEMDVKPELSFVKTMVTVPEK